MTTSIFSVISRIVIPGDRRKTLINGWTATGKEGCMSGMIIAGKLIKKRMERKNIMDQKWDNTNSGALFKNDKKETENHPDYNGNINIEGKEFWLNAWLKTSRAGKKYFSLSVKAKDSQGAVIKKEEWKKFADKIKPTQDKSYADEDVTDDIPF